MSNFPPYNKPFDEQLAFFRQKLNLPTERWDDITLAEHDRAFIVAGAQGADLLDDLRGAVDEAIQQGTGLDAFQKNFERIVAERGWTGWTGEGTAAGRAWRAKVIYQTNMATSYSAGRLRQLSDPALLKILPYWQFHHNDIVIHPRPLHVMIDGLTLPPDHPFWKHTWPPVFAGEMAFGCQCWISAVSKEYFMVAIANGKGPANVPEWASGIDPEIIYAPGMSLLLAEQKALQKIAVKKINQLPPSLAKAFAQDIAEFLMNMTPQTIEDIIALIWAGVITVEAAKKLAKALPGFSADMLTRIDATQQAAP